MTNDEILDRTELIFANGYENLKLYFMIGLPTETDEDVHGIVETGSRFRETALLYHPKHRVDVTVSVSSSLRSPSSLEHWLTKPRAFSRSKTELMCRSSCSS